MAFIQNENKLINLGRYWPNKGPQVTLYVPGAFTTMGSNLIILIEFEGTSCDSISSCQVELIDYPIIDSL